MFKETLYFPFKIAFAYKNKIVLHVQTALEVLMMTKQKQEVSVIW